MQAQRDTAGRAAGSKTELQAALAAGPHSIAGVQGGQALWQAAGLRRTGTAAVAGLMSSMLHGGHDLHRCRRRSCDVLSDCSRHQLPGMNKARKHIRDPSQDHCRP